MTSVPPIKCRCVSIIGGHMPGLPPKSVRIPVECSEHRSGVEDLCDSKGESILNSLEALKLVYKFYLSPLQDLNSEALLLLYSIDDRKYRRYDFEILGRKPVASIWFEMVVDPGQQNFDFYRQISEKFQFFQTISQKFRFFKANL